MSAYNTIITAIPFNQRWHQFLKAYGSGCKYLQFSTLFWRAFLIYTRIFSGETRVASTNKVKLNFRQMLTKFSTRVSNGGFISQLSQYIKWNISLSNPRWCSLWHFLKKNSNDDDVSDDRKIFEATARKKFFFFLFCS
jgi:hypothetical protein